MSCTRTYKTTTVEIKQSDVSNKNLINIMDTACENLTNILNEKLSKISKLSGLLEANVIENNRIILFDPLGIVENLENVCRSFGFMVHHDDKYLILESETLDILNCGTNTNILNLVANHFKINRNLKTPYGKYLYLSESEEAILGIAKTREEKSSINYNETTVKTTTERDGHVLNSIKDTKSDLESIISKRNSEIDMLELKLNGIYDRYQTENQEGVKSILAERAKMLGYTVQEEKENGKIKLTLVRRN